jgi:ribosomal-protein-alanine N-acetyltransferase
MELRCPKVILRPLTMDDYASWHEVRSRCRAWLLPWEPRSSAAGYPEENRSTYQTRCEIRDREWQAGSGFAFGIFTLAEQHFVGEASLSSIQRGPFQSGFIGYWIDKLHAGNGYAPEATATLLAFAFEKLALHRVEVAIVPRNRPSRRVAEKLGLRNEGVSVGYLEIDGRWEDHVRYAITVEEWIARRGWYATEWLGGR